MVKAANSRSSRTTQSGAYTLGMLAVKCPDALAPHAENALTALLASMKRPRTGGRAWVVDNSIASVIRVCVNCEDALPGRLVIESLIAALDKLPMTDDGEEAQDLTKELVDLWSNPLIFFDEGVARAYLQALGRCLQADEKRLTAAATRFAKGRGGGDGEDDMDVDEDGEGEGAGEDDEGSSDGDGEDDEEMDDEDADMGSEDGDEDDDDDDDHEDTDGVDDVHGSGTMGAHFTPAALVALQAKLAECKGAIAGHGGPAEAFASLLAGVTEDSNPALYALLQCMAGPKAGGGGASASADGPGSS